jgi:hypothetical protein
VGEISAVAENRWCWLLPAQRLRPQSLQSLPFESFVVWARKGLRARKIAPAIAAGKTV